VAKHSTKATEPAETPTTPRKLLLFLHKLACRHLSDYGAVAKSLESMAEGKGSGYMSTAYVPDAKMRFTAHLLCVLGQGSEEDRASMLAKTCSAAIETAADKDAESLTQLVEALEILASDDPVGGPTPYDVEALKSQFTGSQVEITERNGRQFYTFKGRAAYPTELTISGDIYRLTNASYRKGTYEKIVNPKPAPAEEPTYAV
jgi:hypothetical protein